MDGTDKADAMQHSVVCVRKSYVWHKKLGLFLLQRLCLVNGFILSRQYGKDNSPRTLSRFTLPVVEKLIYFGNPPNPQRVLGRQEHHLEKIPGTEKRPRPAKCCKLCWKKAPPGTNRVRETRYQCNACENSPALHIDCFAEWHKQ